MQLVPRLACLSTISTSLAVWVAFAGVHYLLQAASPRAMVQPPRTENEKGFQLRDAKIRDLCVNRAGRYGVAASGMTTRRNGIAWTINFKVSVEIVESLLVRAGSVSWERKGRVIPPPLLGVVHLPVGSLDYCSAADSNLMSWEAGYPLPPVQNPWRLAMSPKTSKPSTAATMQFESVHVFGSGTLGLLHLLT
ncbi:hypothetical protein NUW58_g7110 [Xylaria curta]|uniref:Uncharacterized protein n=1 Tax=Xylaria curta TaxID=42375 RepID=A0ACC1NKF1_9PEZI|nr:hypothetical protein NUW58_g7110 [Xylaria curta]